MFYHPYWASFSQPYWASFSLSWISREACADEFVPFVEAGRRRSAVTRRNRRHPIRRRVGWTLVQIGLRLVVRSTEGLPGRPVVPRLQDNRGKTDDSKEG
jgi:hypothetical protein